MSNSLRPRNWGELRAIGNLEVLKVSYLMLLVVPIATTQPTVIRWLGFKPWLLTVLFFASLFLAMAKLIYDLRCPVVIKRFASPNDLYDRMIRIKYFSLKSCPDDVFNASYEHCKTKYKTDVDLHRASRLACTYLFALSAALFFVGIVNRAWIVTVALVDSIRTAFSS